MNLPACQFLLSTTDKVSTLPRGYGHLSIGSYFFHYSPGTIYYQASLEPNIEAILIGEIAYPEQPDLDNRGVLIHLLQSIQSSDNGDFLQSLTNCAGGFFIILKNGNRTEAYHDGCGQFEVFYDLSIEHVSNNPLLIPHRAGEPPSWLLKHKLSVFDYCGFDNVKKLRPNHYLNLNEKNPVRYFPNIEHPITPVHFDDAVTEVANIVSGTLQAFTRRQRTVLPITAGYDSRLLLAACPENKVETFIYRHPGMSPDHIDIQIGAQLAAAKGITHNIYSYDRALLPEQKKLFEQLFLPRMELAPRILNGDAHHFADALLLNGSIGEIGRTYFGINDRVTPTELAIMLGHKKNAAVNKLMKQWLESISLEHCGDGNLLDLFYWEERMGNWAAKAKSELRIATRVVSPMNSHRLWKTVLGVKHKYRTTVDNKLFLGVIEMLDKELLAFPLNPSRKTTMMKAMVKTKVYTPYKKIYWKLKSKL